MRGIILGLVAAALSGCAAIAVSGASQGVSYSVTNVAYRTFTFNQKTVREATLQALRNMQIPYSESKEHRKKGLIMAKTRELEIRIKLKAVTPKATKIAVDARRKFLLKDRAVAVEVINQTAIALGTL